jgi:hypothetical protein
MTIADSHAYRNAIAEIAEASLSVLLGRLPADVKLRESRTILLTGRGARMHGLKDAIVNYLKSHGVDNVTVADVPERLLKASVTIGCRAFAANYWSELKKASDATIDRMLLVYRDTKGVSHCDMLPSETPVDHGGPWVEIPQWTDAKLIATHLRTDAVFDDPRVRLDEKKIGEILDGRLQAPRRQWHPPYSLVLGAKDLPRSDDGRRVKARLLFRREGVAIEEQTV